MRLLRRVARKPTFVHQRGQQALVGAVANASTNWGACYQKAGEICGARGYAVFARSDEPTFSAHTSAHANNPGGAAMYSAATSSNRMMVVQCKSQLLPTVSFLSSGRAHEPDPRLARQLNGRAPGMPRLHGLVGFLVQLLRETVLVGHGNAHLGE